MEYTVVEIAKRLEKTKGDGGISSEAARKRLERYGYKSKRYIGVNAIFELSDDDIEFLKQCDKRGSSSKTRSSSNNIDGLTLKEIADKRNCPIETVKEQLRNAGIKPVGKIDIYTPDVIAMLEAICPKNLAEQEMANKTKELDIFYV